MKKKKNTLPKSRFLNINQLLSFVGSINQTELSDEAKDIVFAVQQSAKDGLNKASKHPIRSYGVGENYTLESLAFVDADFAEEMREPSGVRIPVIITNIRHPDGRVTASLFYRKELFSNTAIHEFLGVVDKLPLGKQKLPVKMNYGDEMRRMMQGDYF